MLACHAGGPGSIPGRCKFITFWVDPDQILRASSWTLVELTRVRSSRWRWHLEGNGSRLMRQDPGFGILFTQTGDRFIWTRKNLFLPRIELRTFRVLGGRDNHYTTETHDDDLAERGFDPRTSGLWAQHASTAPLCYWPHIGFTKGWV